MQTKPVRPAPEPVSVAAALIVNPDIHWYPVIRCLRQVWNHHIPSEYRHDNKHKLHKDFTFHANVSDAPSILVGRKKVAARFCSP